MNITPEYIKALVMIDLKKNETKVLLYILSETWLAERDHVQLSQVDIAAGANIYIAKVTETLSMLAAHRIIDWDEKVTLITPLPEKEWTKKFSQPKEVGEREFDVFDYWNKQDIVKHKDIAKYHPHIKAALRKYSIGDIRKAIENYNTILKSDEYRWDYKWPLDQFLVRGLDRFMDINNPFENFRIKKGAEEKSIYKEL